MTRKLSRRRALQIAAGLMSAESFLASNPLEADEMPPATLRRLKDMTWQPLKSDFFPPGLKVKALHEDKAKHTSLSVVRYPKGYHEPRHYHKACGHWIYILSGRVIDPTQAYTPGTFIYAPSLNVHGPFTAEEQSDVLFFVDGPFDVFGA
jgi:quercetin dioxygenase-like cupin family protein